MTEKKEQKFKVTINKDGIVKWEAVEEKKAKPNLWDVVVTIALISTVLLMIVFSYFPAPNQENTPRQPSIEID
jgi:hypothetical protein